MRLPAAILCAALAATVSSAQDRQGRDTPGDWVVDHYAAFGLWDSICDHRLTDGKRESRCYIRYVDVFSPRPAFAAQFLFVTPGPEVEIGIEPGTHFAAEGIRVETGGGPLWTTAHPGCRLGLKCTFAFDFTDRHGADRELRWDLAPFAAALADFRVEAAKRGL